MNGPAQAPGEAFVPTEAHDASNENSSVRDLLDSDAAAKIIEQSNQFNFSPEPASQGTAEGVVSQVAASQDSPDEKRVAPYVPKETARSLENTSEVNHFANTVTEETFLESNNQRQQGLASEREISPESLPEVVAPIKAAATNSQTTETQVENSAETVALSPDSDIDQAYNEFVVNPIEEENVSPETAATLPERNSTFEAPATESGVETQSTEIPSLNNTAERQEKIIQELERLQVAETPVVRGAANTEYTQKAQRKMSPLSGVLTKAQDIREAGLAAQSQVNELLTRAA